MYCGGGPRYSCIANRCTCRCPCACRNSQLSAEIAAGAGPANVYPCAEQNDMQLNGVFVESLVTTSLAITRGALSEDIGRAQPGAHGRCDDAGER